MKRIRRWWRRANGIEFKLVAVHRGAAEGRTRVLIEIDDDFETWDVLMASKRLVP